MQQQTWARLRNKQRLELDPGKLRFGKYCRWPNLQSFYSNCCKVLIVEIIINFTCCNCANLQLNFEVWSTLYFFYQLIFRKIIKIVATRGQILRLKCTKFDFGWGSALDLAGGAYSAPPDPPAGFKGAYFF